MLDDGVPLGPTGSGRSPRFHREPPLRLRARRAARITVGYLPAESDSGLFGGNSNWRGPIWFPVNYLHHRVAASASTTTTATTSRSSARPARGTLGHPAARSPTSSRAGSSGSSCPARTAAARASATTRRSETIPLPRTHPVPRVLPRRHRPRLRRLAPDRLDRPGGGAARPRGGGVTGPPPPGPLLPAVSSGC